MHSIILLNGIHCTDRIPKKTSNFYQCKQMTSDSSPNVSLLITTANQPWHSHGSVGSNEVNGQSLALRS